MKKSKKERLVKWLKNGEINKFNRYRKLTKYVKIDLSGVDLSAIILSKVNFIKVNLIEANLQGSILCGADLYNANLTKANLQGSNLSGAYLNNIQGKHIFKTSGNGSQGREIWYILEDDYINAGCWDGTLDEFEKRVENEYGHDKDSYEYKSYQDVIEYYRKKKNRF